MHLVVGLGNPGQEYAGSRHNVGFAVVEELAWRWGLSLGPARHEMRIVLGVVAGKHVALIEPQMYMNMSGPALVGAGQEVDVTQLVAVHDDLDLELGGIRVKRGGGTAGHRGLRSIVECYGEDFVRVRIGVGRPPGKDAITYVLSKFNDEERETIAAAITRAADAVECIVAEGEERAMNTFNVRTPEGPLAPAESVGRK
ncbi:MAG TPA: aminoacyl-tRNA hydrolase [Candidatus Binatia bacterium]